MFPGCPLCWAAASALVASGASGPAILAARRDFATWSIGLILGGTGLVHRFGDLDIFIPWWWYLVIGLVLYLRVGYLVVQVLQVKRRERSANKIRQAVGI